MTLSSLEGVVLRRGTWDEDWNEHGQDTDRAAVALFFGDGQIQIERHTLSVLVDNEPGVLARVVGLFSGRGYNIESLTVAEVAHETHLSRITIVTSGTPETIEQIRHQLERLVPVHSVKDLTLTVRAIERELAMIKVRGKGENRVEAMNLAEAFRAKVIDATVESFIFELTGAPQKIDDFVVADAPARPGRSLPHRRRRDLARAGADLAVKGRHDGHTGSFRFGLQSICPRL